MVQRLLKVNHCIQKEEQLPIQGGYTSLNEQNLPALHRVMPRLLPGLTRGLLIPAFIMLSRLCLKCIIMYVK